MTISLRGRFRMIFSLHGCVLLSIRPFGKSCSGAVFEELPSNPQPFSMRAEVWPPPRKVDDPPQVTHFLSVSRLFLSAFLSSPFPDALFTSLSGVGNPSFALGICYSFPIKCFSANFEDRQKKLNPNSTFTIGIRNCPPRLYPTLFSVQALPLLWCSCGAILFSDCPFPDLLSPKL